jgi:hypothetical protein
MKRSEFPLSDVGNPYEAMKITAIRKGFGLVASE